MNYWDESVRRKSGGVVIPMDNELVYLAGGEIRSVKPLPPYCDVVCRFLDALSHTLLKDPDCKAYPDITAVAFWARRGNIEKLKRRIGDCEVRIGRGLAFHVTPSNIPVQFIFSYMFGLLAGNANIVRVTTKDYPEISLICNGLKRVLADYPEIKDMTSIVRYPRESSHTEKFSAQCQIRLVWGGDNTISRIREYPISPRTVELVFPDRYSLALLHAGAVEEADEAELRGLAQNFYNDTFLMDQNACSSPQLILWQDGGNHMRGKDRFWTIMEEVAKKRYELPPIKVTSKYADICRNAVCFSPKGQLSAKTNYLYHVPLRELSKDMENLRGQFGLFYEYDINSLNELEGIVNGKYQTLTYYGVRPEDLAENVLENNWMGIDRIVPIGKALDMDVIWDGYDLVREMSRIVDVR